MKTLDRIIQNMRVKKAIQTIPNGSRVLDIGCYDGFLLKQLSMRISSGVGIDPELKQEIQNGKLTLYRGSFPNDLPVQKMLFDVIVLLAVFEHIPAGQQKEFAVRCGEFLRRGGILIMTTPSPLVDEILHVLVWMGLVDGMSLEQHYGFEPRSVPEIFRASGFQLNVHRRFEFGLNHLFVFEKG